MAECSFILLCNAFSKARTEFQSDFLRSDKSIQNINVIKQNWLERGKKDGKKLVSEGKWPAKKAFNNIWPAPLIENVSKSNYSALPPKANVVKYSRAKEANKKLCCDRSLPEIICSFKSNYKDL